MRLARAVFLLPLLLSCSMMGGEEGEWSERQIADAPPMRDLLAYCAQAMAQAGYPAPRVDEARDSVVSDWRLELQAFAGAGRRYRASIEVVGYDADVAKLRARVETEKNEEKGRPMDIVLAKWESMPDDVQRARILLQHVSSLLVSSGVGVTR